MASSIRSCSQIARKASASIASRPSLSFPRRTIASVPSSQAEKRQREKELLELERQILNPERAETAQSGTDNKVGDDRYAYDPSTTNPEIEFRIFEEATRINGDIDPLFISPANRDFSQLLSPTAGGAVHNLDKTGPSSRGWTRKHKEVHIKTMGSAEYDQYERLLRGLRKVQKREKLFGSSAGNSEKTL